VIGGIKSPEPAANILGALHMAIADRRTDSARSAVDHEPKPAVLIALKFDEMIPTAECCELDHSFVMAHRLQSWVTERRGCQIHGRSDYCASIPATRRYGAAESSEDSASHNGIVQRGRFDIETNCQHAAANISTYGLRIDQVRRRNDHADADIRCEMYVWHDSYLLDVRRASEALDRFRHVLVQGFCKPGAD
jgi:hypothetical protein